MMEKKNLLCFSHTEFDKNCITHGWNDSCVPPDIAFISIVGTEECQKYYLEETEEHYFKEPHPNVLNLEFDDISEEYIDWKGHRFLGFSDSQALKTYEFIKSNLGKDFWIHCRAGASRSQGVVRFILDTYGNLYDWQTRKSNPCVTPNYFVTGKLKRLAYEDIDGLGK